MEWQAWDLALPLGFRPAAVMLDAVLENRAGLQLSLTLWGELWG